MTPMTTFGIALAAKTVDDLEGLRKATENRIRSLTRDIVDKDGVIRGAGLPSLLPEIQDQEFVLEQITVAEATAIKSLQRVVKAHQLGPWIKTQKGCGEKQVGRLLGAIGDPYWNAAEERPRLVSELWAYCGHGDPGRQRRTGMTQEDAFALGSKEAKMRVWNIANSCLKQPIGTTYRDIYIARRQATIDREHTVPCKRCGPSGSPALPGSPWPDAHKHADALRIVGKEFLRNLWREAARLHGAGVEDVAA